MRKRLILVVTLIILALEISMHYSINLGEIKKPPSSTWSKEVLLDTADIQYAPKIVKYKGNYVIAYNNGQSIKLLTTDNFGKKINEKNFPKENQMPYDITILTDGNKLYLSFTKYDSTKNIETMILDEKLNVEKTSEIKNIADLVQIDDKAMAVSYEDRVDIIDVTNNSMATIKEPSTKFLMATKYNDGYVVAYGKQNGKYFYSIVRNGKASEPKLAGTLDETTTTSFYNTVIAVAGNDGYILGEYRANGEFGGAMELKFSLDNPNYSTGDFKVSGEKVFISNVMPYFQGKDASVLASTYISRGKKNEYLNLALINLSGKRDIVPVSKIRGSVVYEAASDDKVIFCQPIEKGKTQLYMTSSNIEFISRNDYIRGYEYKAAFFETLEKILFGFTYILVYGIVWFVPAVVFNAISFLFAYRCRPVVLKLWFILSYAIALGLKCYFIKGVSYDKMKYFTPEALSLPVGMAICAFLSIIYCIYGYRRYVKDIDNNMMMVDFSLALGLDTITTLILFVPFFT